MNGYGMAEYQRAAMSVAQITSNVLTQRPGTDPTMIRQWILTKTNAGDVWLFAELDDQQIAKFEPYEAATHHLSSSLRGMPVLVSNHTGLRLAFLLSPVRKLPNLILLPTDVLPGRVMFGPTLNGKIAGGAWGKVGHMVIAGKTGAGKSGTVRSIVYQALHQGFHLILGDMDGTTFPMMTKNPALMVPLAQSAQEFIDALKHAVGEIEARKNLYIQSGKFPESVEEYNKNATEPLKRILIVLDEFNTAITDTGGPNGELAKLATQVASRGRKFGITLVMAAQDFSKEVIGRVRDQVGAMIVHRVRSEEVARNVGVVAAARISEKYPGRAITDQWGQIQCYFCDKSRLEDGQVSGHVSLLTPDERALAERAMKESDGKISLDILVNKFGMGQGAARRLQDGWKLRGWAANDPQRANGLYMTTNHPFLATNLQTLQTPTNRLQTLQTGATNLQTEPTNLQTGLQTLQTEPTYY